MSAADTVMGLSRLAFGTIFARNLILSIAVAAAGAAVFIAFVLREGPNP